MADLNEGTRQRNLRKLSGSAAVPSRNLREESGTFVVRGTPTDIIQAMGGRIGGWTIQNGMLTADGGNVRLNSYVPSISLGAATGFASGAGIWEGNEGGVYKWRVGDPLGHLISWDGTTLDVNGTISATSGDIGGWTIETNSIAADGGAAVISSNTPKITLGAASDFMTGQGVFMGKSGGSYSFHIGKPNGTPPLNYLAFDGATGALTLKGSVTTDSLNPSLQSFTSNIVFSSTDWNTVSWGAGTIKLASGVTYSIVAGNTGDMAALTYIYLDVAISTTALQTTTSYNTAMGDGKRVIAVAQNAANSSSGGASVIPFGGGQPLINGNSQITASSIMAGQIAAGAITASKISISDLAQIGSANIGSCHINSVLDIGTSGGIWQGTGTFAAPTTGLKFWNESGVGRLAGYNGGTIQTYFGTDGKLYAGAGGVVLHADGISLAAGSSYPVIAAKKLKFVNGSTLIASVAALYTPNYSLELAAGSGETARLTLVDEAGTDRCYLGVDKVDIGGNTDVGNAMDGSHRLWVYGRLVVGNGTTEPANNGDIKAAGQVYIGGDLHFTSNTNVVKFNNGGEYSQIGLTGGWVSYWANNAYWTGSQWNYVSTSGYGGVTTLLLNSSGVFDFQTANNAANPVAWNSRLRIQNDGKIGIGTQSPTANLDINGNTLRLRTKRVPAHTDPGNSGEICWTDDWIFVCVASGDWRRAGLGAY